MNKNSVIVLLLIALCALAALALPGQLVSLIGAQTDMITAEGHKALDLAAAEAIKANARQVDAVTAGIQVAELLACLVPLTLVACGLMVIAALFIAWRDKRGDEDYG